MSNRESNGSRGGGEVGNGADDDPADHEPEDHDAYGELEDDGFGEGGGAGGLDAAWAVERARAGEHHGAGHEVPGEYPPLAPLPFGPGGGDAHSAEMAEL